MDSSLDLLRPGDAGYDEATSPWTASAVQKPALVARVRAGEGGVAAGRGGQGRVPGVPHCAPGR